MCYQTYAALGFSDDFSDVLAKILDQIDELALTPSEEVLHTCLSIQEGVNFNAEHNIPDFPSFRNLIVFYYKSEPKRKWKSGIFAEALD